MTGRRTWQRWRGGAENKEHLRAEILRRIEHLLTTGDTRAVLEPAAERIAAKLLEKAQESVAGVPAMEITDGYALAMFHWHRSQVLPPAQAAVDLEHSKVYFRSLVTVAPEYVPAELRDNLFDNPEDRSRIEAMTLAKQASESLSRARQNHDVGELGRAVSLTKRLLTLDLPDGTRTHFHAGLSHALRDRYEWAGDPDDLDGAIAAAELAVATAEAGSPAEDDYRTLLDALTTRRYEGSGTLEHLDAVVDARRARLAAAPEEVRTAVRLRLSESLLDRCDVRFEPTDLREALGHALPGPDDVEDEHLLVLRFALLQRCHLHDEAHVGESALITAGRAALGRLSDDDQNAPAIRTSLARYHLRRYTSSGHSSDLVEALSLAQYAVEAMPDDDERRVTAQGVLADAILQRHEQSTRTIAIQGFGEFVGTDLDTALRLFRECVDRTPPGHPRRRTVFDDLGDAYARGADIDERPDLRHAAVDAYAKALGASVGVEERCEALRKLALGLQQRYVAFRDESDLDRAVELCHQAVAIAPPGTYYEQTARLGLAESSPLG
jgi:tetratricopeptide (TPR) repeat protein